MYIYQFTDNTNYESIYAWFSQLTQIQKNSIIGMLRIDFLPILVQRIGGAASHLRLKIMLLDCNNCIRIKNDKFIE